MRLISIFISLLLILSCSGPKNAVSQLSKYNGSWFPVNQEIGGKALPKAAFEKQRLIIKDSTYTLIAESIDKGIVKVNGNKMDIYGREGVNKGQHFTAIYKYENNQLCICYNLKGDGYPESFETKPKTLLFLSIFQKEMK